MSPLEHAAWFDHLRLMLFLNILLLLPKKKKKNLASVVLLCRIMLSSRPLSKKIMRLEQCKQP